MKLPSFGFYQHLQSPEIKAFPQIIMFCGQQYQRVEIDSLSTHQDSGIEICYGMKGKFHWQVEEKKFELNPGEVSVTCPWQRHGGQEGVMNLGQLQWLILKPRQFSSGGRLVLGSWSYLDKKNEVQLGKQLARNVQPLLGNLPEVGRLFSELYREVTEEPLGYSRRVNMLLADLLLIIGRRLQKPAGKNVGIPEQYLNVFNRISADPGHPWTNRELAALAGLKVTAFNEGVKRYTGMSPREFLIRLRLQQAKKLLVRKELSITAIAFDTGFASSQHFANTFKRHTGVTPVNFRKKNLTLKSED